MQRIGVLAHFLAAACVSACSASVCGAGGAPCADDAAVTNDAVASDHAVVPGGDARPDAPTSADVPVTPDAGIACGRTMGHFALAIGTWDGIRESCSVPVRPPGNRDSRTITGAVTAITDRSFTIDMCPPNADCPPQHVDIELDAPGARLAEAIPMGGFVAVTYRFARSWGCTSQVRVSNVPNWGGEVNPAGANSRMLFAAAEGEYEPLPASPFSIERVSLGCRVSGMTCGEPADDFALRFASTSSPSDPAVTVGMGREGAGVFGAGVSRAPYRVQNLRSFNTGYCDDYWNYAWFVAARPFER